MTELEKQFEYHYHVISSDGFLNRRGLGNEVPFFISTFPAEQQVQADRLVDALHKRLVSEGKEVLKIDLFGFCLEQLDQQGVLDDYIECEPQLDKNELKHALVATLDVQRKLAPAIAQLLSKQEWAVLFLTGVGKVYPLIRTHTVLANLQSISKSQPTVLFFPGRYTFVDGSGSSLDLFGVLNEDRYYRAFNLNNYQLQEAT